MQFEDGRILQWTKDSSSGLYTTQTCMPHVSVSALISATARSILRRLHNEAAHAPAHTMRRLVSSIPPALLPRKEVDELAKNCSHCAEQKDNRNRTFDTELSNTDEDTTDADIVVLRPPSHGYVGALVTKHRLTKVISARPLRSHAATEIQRA